MWKVEATFSIRLVVSAVAKPTAARLSDFTNRSVYQANDQAIEMSQRWYASGRTGKYRTAMGEKA
jgi:hypothetical protein